MPGGSDTTALNWAGYIATGGTYTSVSGSWVVPSVTTSDATADVADATWVGIGGVTRNDLIQAGTEAIPDSSGQLVYRAWMETLPQDSKIVPLTVAPGDAVSISITESTSGVWEVSFENDTTGQSYVTSVQYDSSLSSADWVEEMPVEVGGVIGLDDFGTINFTSGYAIKNGQAVTIQSSGATALTMDNARGETIATPSSLGADGSSFSVSRSAAASTPLALIGGGIATVAPTGYAGFTPGSYSIRTTHRRNGGYRISISF